MAQSFNCPSCGAPLDYIDNGSSTMRCPYCNASVIVPETLRRSSGSQADFQAGAMEMAQSLAHVKEVTEIARLLRSGNKIEAIKVYRAAFGTDLKDAKDAVEALERGEPLKFSTTMVRTTSTGNSTQFSHPVYSPAPVPPTQKKNRLGLIIGLIVIGGFIGVALLVGTIFANDTSSSLAGNAGDPTLNVYGGPTQQASQAPEKPSATAGPAAELLAFGEEGTGAGMFNDARSVAVDAQGKIYIGEYSGGRVQVFDASGKLITQWNTGDRKSALRGLAVDRAGILYAVQGGALQRFHAGSGQALDKIADSHTNNFVDDVTIGADGSILITYGGENLALFDAKGKRLLDLPKPISTVTDKSELDTRVAMDGLGNIYALGTFNNAVFKFSPEGKYIDQFGGEGDQPGQFRAPEAVVLDGKGRMYVSDIKGVQIFDSSGRYLNTIQVEGAAFGLAVDDQSNLYVITNKPKLYKFKLNVP